MTPLNMARPLALKRCSAAATFLKSGCYHRYIGAGTLRRKQLLVMCLQNQRVERLKPEVWISELQKSATLSSNVERSPVLRTSGLAELADDTKRIFTSSTHGAICMCAFLPFVFLFYCTAYTSGITRCGWLLPSYVPSRIVDSQTKHKQGYNEEALEYYPERGGKVRRCAGGPGVHCGPHD
jgi:hypothetical protein